MKTIILVISVITVLSFNGYSQTTKVSELLKNKETRNETFNAILNNHELMMDFMAAMKGNEHAMMMMKGNNQMMNDNGKSDMHQEYQNMNHDQMMSNMNENPEMMQKMMGNMMEMCEKDSAMRCKMADMMTQHPKMMNTMMQKMKGKDIKKMDDMPMMQKQKDENNQLHQH
ncbi:MAG: hypothetical protein WAO52_11910 [Prolixibacteraceae bacterium]|jgi:hypothetical protein